MLLVRCLDSPRDFLATCRDENEMCFDFQKTFQSTDIFCTLSLLFVQPGFPFFVLVWLFILLPLIWFLGSLTNKRQWQRHRYSGCVRVRWNSLFIWLLFKTTTSKGHILLIRENTNYSSQFLKRKFFSNFDTVIRTFLKYFWQWLAIRMTLDMRDSVGCLYSVPVWALSCLSKPRTIFLFCYVAFDRSFPLHSFDCSFLWISHSFYCLSSLYFFGIKISKKTSPLQENIEWHPRKN